MAHKSSLGSAVFSGLGVEEVALGQEGLGDPPVGINAVN
jgi:hypothetical protein